MFKCIVNILCAVSLGLEYVTIEHSEIVVIFFSFVVYIHLKFYIAKPHSFSVLMTTDEHELTYSIPPSLFRVRLICFVI